MAGEKKYIALEETSQDILSNIGNTDDSETTDTLYGRVNNIITKEDNLKQLGLTTDTKVDDILSAVGSTSDTGGTNTTGSAMAKINALLEKTKFINHIQRGLIKITASSSNIGTKSETVTLVGFSNVENMIVLLDGSAGYTKSGITDIYSPYLKSLTKDTLEVGVAGINNTYSISYQVIEFS